MEKLDLHGKTGFIIGGTRGIGTYKYHNTCAEAMLPLDGDAYIHVAPAGPADHSNSSQPDDRSPKCRKDTRFGIRHIYA